MAVIIRAVAFSSAVFDRLLFVGRNILFASHPGVAPTGFAEIGVVVGGRFAGGSCARVLWFCFIWPGIVAGLV